jgi:hypothetical protein
MGEQKMLRQVPSVLPVLFFVNLGSGGASFAQSITIFGNRVPENPVDDGNAVTAHSQVS